MVIALGMSVLMLPGLGCFGDHPSSSFRFARAPSAHKSRYTCGASHQEGRRELRSTRTGRRLRKRMGSVLPQPCHHLLVFAE